MTDDQQKAWDKFVASYCDPRIIQKSGSTDAILAADAEFKRLREELRIERELYESKCREVLTLRARVEVLEKAVEWACDKRVWAHFEHIPNEREWDYYVNELRRKAKEG